MKTLRSTNIADLSAHYGWPPEFVSSILSRITNAADLWRACRMYHDGTLSIADVNADGEPPVDIPALRHTIASNHVAKRKLRDERIREMMAKQQAIAEYYNACQRVDMDVPGKDGKCHGAKHSAFIRDGRLVAFGYWDTTGTGGIYMANNDVMPDFRWNELHDNLGHIRRAFRPFYKAIKKACHNEPPATFRFDERTIRKQADA